LDTVVFLSSQGLQYIRTAFVAGCMMLVVKMGGVTVISAVGSGMLDTVAIRHGAMSAPIVSARAYVAPLM
jgi:hypothetical protein